MKAKQYADEFRDNIKSGQDKLEATGRIVMGLMKETIDIAQARQCKDDDAFLSVWEEIETKWRRICDMLPEERFKPDGMWLFLQNAYPDLSAAISTAKAMRRIRKERDRKH